MKKVFWTIIYLIFSTTTYSQDLFLDETTPVIRNVGFFNGSGQVMWQTVFAARDIGMNKLSDIKSVTLSGKVIFNENEPTQKFEMNLAPDGTDGKIFDGVIKINSENTITTLSERLNNRRWLKLEVLTTYVINNIRYSLPEVIFQNTQTPRENSKIEIKKNGLLLDSSITFNLNITGVYPIRLSRIEISDGNGSKNSFDRNQLTDYSGIGNKNVTLPIILQKKQYNIYIEGESIITGEVIKEQNNVNFEGQTKITSINGDINISNGYKFNLFDTSINTFKITTIGDAQISVESLSPNYAVNLVHALNGVYELTIVTKKLVFDDNAQLIFYSNNIRLKGIWELFRPDLITSLSISQAKNNSVEFSFSFPSWVKGNVEVEIPKNSSTHLIQNFKALSTTKGKEFKLTLNKTSFNSINDSSDSLFTGSIIVKLSGKRIISQEFSFLNLDFYLNKIQQAQAISKKSERKEELKKILLSLFETTGNQPQDPDLKSIINNLASKNTSDRKEGQKQIIDTVIRLAPLLIMLI